MIEWVMHMANRKNRRQRGWAPPTLNESWNLPDYKLVDMNDAPDEMKVSAKLIDIMEPWTDEMDIAILADCAAVAWNSSIDGCDDYSSYDLLIDTCYSRSEYGDLIKRLKKRKNKMYPNDLRTIVRLQVKEDENGDPRILVASQMEPENMMKALERLIASVKEGKEEKDDGQ